MSKANWHGQEAHERGLAALAKIEDAEQRRTAAAMRGDWKTWQAATDEYVAMTRGFLAEIDARMAAIQR
jgi:hypothetical protein